MNLSERNRKVLLWTVSILLLIGMIISFMPGVMSGGGGITNATDPTVLSVNGQPITESQVNNLKQNPPFNTIVEGPVAKDLQLVVVDQLVSQALLQQASKDESIGFGEVRERVNQFREQQNVAGSANDTAYLNLIASLGYTDTSFREYMKGQLRQEKYLNSLGANGNVTDAEIKTYYEANPGQFQTDPAVKARQIVLNDMATAKEVFAETLQDANFAQLAKKHSTVDADKEGAVGAAAESTAPSFVGKIAFPSAVADAVFALSGPGITKPVTSGGKVYIVKAEAFATPTTKPLDEVRGQIKDTLTQLKKDAAQEKALNELKATASVSAPKGSDVTYNNPVVAKVGDYEIKAADLDRNTYLNEQISQMLTPDFADIIYRSIKPSVLKQMIDEQLAFQGSSQIKGATFVGPRSAVAQAAANFESLRTPVKTDDAAVKAFYTKNKANYTTPAIAIATRYTFSDKAKAEDFQKQVAAADKVDALEAKATPLGGKSADLGVVNPSGVEETLSKALFNFKRGMTPIGTTPFEVSDVITLKEDPPAKAKKGTKAKESFVVLVAARAQAKAQPLAEVRPQVVEALKQDAQSKAQQDWLAALRKDVKVEELLDTQTTSSSPSGSVSLPSTLPPGSAPQVSGKNAPQQPKTTASQDAINTAEETARKIGQQAEEAAQKASPAQKGNGAAATEQNAPASDGANTSETKTTPAEGAAQGN